MTYQVDCFSTELEFFAFVYQHLMFSSKKQSFVVNEEMALFILSNIFKYLKLSLEKDTKRRFTKFFREQQKGQALLGKNTVK